MSLRASFVAFLLAAAPSADSFIEWARRNAVVLPPLDGPGDVAGLDVARDVIGSARVVALGEPTHGAREPLEFRDRLFRYLVERHGFTAIALETGITESRRIADFVAGGPGDAAAAAKEGLTWGFGAYPENVSLIRWMREYNADPAHKRKLRFYGFDLSGGGNATFSTARVAVESTLAYLSRTAPAASAEVRRDVEPYLDRFAGDEYLKMTAAERVAIGAAVDRLLAFIKARRAELIAASSADEYEWAERGALGVVRLDRVFQVWPPDPTSGLVSPDLYKATSIRDDFMADTIEWIQAREGTDGRVLVFAHNGHVMNADVRGGIWAVYRQPAMAMGQPLKRRLGSDVIIIGTASAKAGTGAPPNTHPPGTLDLALDKVGPRPFLLDLRPLRGTPSEARAWLGADQTLRVGLITASLLPPLTAFDVLIYFDSLNSTVPPTPAP